MQQKVLIINSRNLPPEEELAVRLQELDNDWRIISANTSIATLGQPAVAQVFYVTTVIVEKSA